VQRNASMMGLPDGRKSFKIGLVVLKQNNTGCDRQPPTQPASQPRCRSKDAAYYVARVKTGYTSVHSTLSSMQNVTVQLQKHPPLQGYPSSFPFTCCQITTQREKSFNISLRGRKRHKIQ